MMRYTWIDEYLLRKPGVTKDLQESWNWIRYMVGGKMFAAICLGEDDRPYYINLKLEPLEGDFYRKQYPGDVIPGYYSNKLHWNSINPDGVVPDELLQEMLEKSYHLVLGGFTALLVRFLRNRRRDSRAAILREIQEAEIRQRAPRPQAAPPQPLPRAVASHPPQQPRQAPKAQGQAPAHPPHKSAPPAPPAAGVRTQAAPSQLHRIPRTAPAPAAPQPPKSKPDPNAPLMPVKASIYTEEFSFPQPGSAAPSAQRISPPPPVHPPFTRPKAGPKPEAPQSEPQQPEASKSTQAAPEPTKSEPGKAAPPKAEPAKPEPSKAEPPKAAKPKPDPAAKSSPADDGQLPGQMSFLE